MKTSMITLAQDYIYELYSELENLDDMSEDIDQKRTALNMRISNIWYDIENP